MNVAARYLDAVARLDWETAEGCLSESVRRVGPFGDVYEGRDRYLAFLRELMPTLNGYRMQIERVVPSSDGSVTVVELSETVEIDSRPLRTPECLVFDIGPDDRISAIAIYIVSLGGQGR